MRLMNEKSLNEVYSDWLVNGVFKQLDAFDVPWKDFVDGSIIDMDYHGNKSGCKLVSPLVSKLLVNDELPSERQSQLATLIWKKYGVAWKKAWDAINSEYDPLNNYKIKKTEKEDKTFTIDGTKTIDKSISDTGTIKTDNTGDIITENNENLVHNGTNNSVGNTNNSIFGFNSDNASNADKSTSNQDNTINSTDVNQINSKVTDGRSELVTKNLSTKDDSTMTDETSHTTDGTLVTDIDGNTGTKTPQEMLDNELKLRFDWSIFDLIYKNVDDVLTINIFKETILC